MMSSTDKVISTRHPKRVRFNVPEPTSPDEKSNKEPRERSNDANIRSDNRSTEPKTTAVKVVKPLPNSQSLSQSNNQSNYVSTQNSQRTQRVRQFDADLVDQTRQDHDELTNLTVGEVIEHFEQTIIQLKIDHQHSITHLQHEHAKTSELLNRSASRYNELVKGVKAAVDCVKSNHSISPSINQSNDQSINVSASTSSLVDRMNDDMQFNQGMSSSENNQSID